MFWYASTRHKQEPGICKMGTLIVCPVADLYVFSRCPNNHQTAIPHQNLIISLGSCLSGSKDDAVSGTRFDLWAMVKNATKNSAQIVAFIVVVVVVVVVVTSFPTKIHENTHMYNTFTVVSTQNFRMYFVSGCQKKLRLIELAATTYVTYNFVARLPGPARRRWHTDTLVVVSRNHFHPMDFITFIQSFCQGLYLDTCHFIKCLFNDILHLYGIRSFCTSFHSFAPLILTALSPRVSLAGGISSFPSWRKS